MNSDTLFLMYYGKINFTFTNTLFMTSYHVQNFSYHVYQFFVAHSQFIHIHITHVNELSVSKICGDNFTTNLELKH